MKKYCYTKKIDLNFFELLDELRFVFSDNWFWIVSNVNISEKINKNIDSEFKNYVVLWVCKPDLAYKYLTYNLELWIFMPCSVAVYEKEDGVYISIWLPDILSNWFIEDESLIKFTSELSSELVWIIDEIK